ncbi:hypothetical protein K0T92_01830 [Paenibacillus oenotherae]|uniref:Uncharacterized protein n=1 Tax=Paenibacillus oenotherae TaxID=1435645 RepID=A0ABS7D258_9BACL|nr:hypothetical protein [Paenibacillus oenotherae]MBW7473481.1 hypothetical protein [Paenibacillus oenotherae]
MSRMEKFGSRHRNVQSQGSGEPAVQTRVADAGIPSRRKTHPSNKGQMTKWFYRFLIVLFLMLLGGLLLWGKHNSGELPLK